MAALGPADDVEDHPSLTNETDDPTKGEESGGSIITRYVWAISQLAMSLVFAYSGIVQMNDPDWHLWFVTYTFTSFVCAGLLFQSVGASPLSKLPWTPMAQSAAMLSGFALVVLTVSQGGVNFSIYTEEGREACGLALVSIWMTLSWRASPRGVRGGRRGGASGSGGDAGAAAVASLLLGLASVALVSIWAVPRYLLDSEHLGEHCQGIGFGPEL